MQFGQSCQSKQIIAKPAAITRRAALVAFDVATCTAIVACAWIALARPAAAYVDPSVMTYTIQALAGVAVALSAVLGVVFRRSRRVIMRWLHIDENAGKTVEPAVEQIAPEQKAATDEQARVELAAARSKGAAGTSATQGAQPFETTPPKANSTCTACFCSPRIYPRYSCAI